MHQLTLRGFDDELRRCIGQLAESRGISLNKAALLMLRRGAGLDEPGSRPVVVGDSLDHLIGTWSEEEAAEFSAAVASCEQIDETFWQ